MFKNGEAVVEIHQYASNGKQYDDGLHKVFVNAAYQGTDEIGILLPNQFGVRESKQ